MYSCNLFKCYFCSDANKTAKVKPDADAKPKKKPASTDEFNTLMAEYYKAWNTLNVSNPAKYYSQEPGLIFYDIAPLQYKGWKQYQTGVAELFQGFASFRLIPNNDLTVTRKGKMAWTTQTLHLSGKQKDGKAMELDARHTAIWEKVKGKWLIVHEHISVPLPDAPVAQ
ncbi:MAG: YybH family protein [Acidobacteriota bacterium]